MIQNEIVDGFQVHRDGSELVPDLHGRFVPVPDQIDQGGLFPPDDVGVQGDPVGDGPESFEEVSVGYVRADPVDTVGDARRFHPHLHDLGSMAIRLFTVIQAGSKIKRRCPAARLAPKPEKALH